MNIVGWSKCQGSSVVESLPEVPAPSNHYQMKKLIAGCYACPITREHPVSFKSGNFDTPCIVCVLYIMDLRHMADILLFLRLTKSNSRGESLVSLKSCKLFKMGQGNAARAPPFAQIEARRHPVIDAESPGPVLTLLNDVVNRWFKAKEMWRKVSRKIKILGKYHCNSSFNNFSCSCLYLAPSILVMIDVALGTTGD